METVNNMAAAAAKAVWGDNQQHGQEPVSGLTGDTSKGEPYDAGNIEDPKVEDANGSASETKAAAFSKQTGTAVESEDTPDNPSTNIKEADAPKDTTKGQNDVRDPEDPNTNPKSAPTDVNNADDGPNEAQKLGGPGPKSLEEVAREKGGDAGIPETSTSKEVPSGDKRAEEEQESGPQAKSLGEGTGEQYVKSTGLNADGGDFDATKPGAGREAERLLEEKGVHPGGSDAKGTSDESVGSKASGDSPKDKKSLGKKIKDKLHRH
ncbi:hypothetical protein F4775DRAFT_35242 [Biscogniauxia sp. FL1348]|nr:hypothetical protein F4775DRAFT_35242 [Biscogniauxia sp. FL1348]